MCKSFVCVINMKHNVTKLQGPIERGRERRRNRGWEREWHTKKRAVCCGQPGFRFRFGFRCHFRWLWQQYKKKCTAKVCFTAWNRTLFSIGCCRCCSCYSCCFGVSQLQLHLSFDLCSVCLLFCFWPWSWPWHQLRLWHACKCPSQSTLNTFLLLRRNFQCMLCLIEPAAQSNLSLRIACLAKKDL